MTDVVKAAAGAEDRDPGDTSAWHLGGNVDGKRGTWLVRHNTALTVASACVTPILYLFYVNHYALNVFQFDALTMRNGVHAEVKTILGFGNGAGPRYLTKTLLPA